jgi:hypothetical protein
MRPGGFPRLNFPECQARIEFAEGRMVIWDELRKKKLVLTQEEWVRQHLVHYLIQHLNYPAGLSITEKKVNVNGLSRRLDLAIMSPEGRCILLAECKAPEVELTEETVHQIAAYAKPLQPELMLLTNGIRHICFRIFENQIQFLETIPAYQPTRF